MNEYPFLIGYSRVDITPDESVPLRGYGNSSQRMSESVHDPICATCVAFSDREGNTAIVFNTDLISSIPEVTTEARKRIGERTGLDPECVMISASHSHTAPDLLNKAEPSIGRYIEKYTTLLVDCAEQALADRKPAKLYYGSRILNRMNFVRIYHRDEDRKPVSHLEEPDRQMQVVQICREGGKDIVMMNWQAHADYVSRVYGRHVISADYIGTLRDYIEELMDCHFAYVQGACGNLTVTSKLADEALPRDPVFYGEALGNYALAALHKRQPVGGDKVSFINRIENFPGDHTEDYLLPEAKEVVKFWKETNDIKATKAFAAPYGIHSPYHANAIIRRATAGDMLPALLTAVAIGDLAIAFTPHETFSDSGVYIKENSPYAYTFLASNANCEYEYQPNKLSFDFGCYERDARDFVRGSSEKISEIMVDLLREMK